MLSISQIYYLLFIKERLEASHPILAPWNISLWEELNMFISVVVWDPRISSVGWELSIPPLQYVSIDISGMYIERKVKFKCNFKVLILT